MTAHAFSYAHASALDVGAAPRLALATSGPGAAQPHFFDGRLLQPRLAAQLLAAVGVVVGARYFTPPGTLARTLRLADPIVTCGAGVLRFEGFSSCGSTYARADFLPGAYQGDIVGKGTTNVDFNAPLRAALAQLRDDAGLALAVGRDALTLASGGSQLHERKVDLPPRWLRALVEVQACQAAMQQRAELPAVHALRLLRTLPRASTARTPLWLAHGSGGWHVTSRAVDDGVRFTDTTRLRLLQGLLQALSPQARALAVHADAAQQASAWVLDFGSARFTLALSAEVWRGFSGEGRALHALLRAGGDASAATLAQVRAALQWQDTLDIDRLAQQQSLAPAAVADALHVLGASGLVGFDVAAGSHFHRVLPFDLSAMDDLHPRLAAARELVDAGAVAWQSRSPLTAHVSSGGVQHSVRLDGADWRCTCPWFARHQGQRGPCKHVLAAQASAPEDG